MGKHKFPLQHCLTILNDAVKHVQEHPSIASDSGTPERNTKHCLQHVLNQLNLKVEMSDHQIVAALLGLPSILCSDAFACGNPIADEHCRLQMADAR